MDVVYLVCGGCAGDYSVIAIYRDKQKAEKRAEQENRSCHGLDAYVEKWEVSE